MDDIELTTIPAKTLFEKYNISEIKFKERFSALVKDINQYLNISGLKKDEVFLNKYSLVYMLVDYFLDIGRLKEFHQIEHINSIKIVSYIAYWFLKRKPIQVLCCDENALYINEKFIVIYILDFLMSDERGNLLDRKEKGLLAFKEQLYYFLKFRHADAQAIEMMIISFFAGQIYQNKDKDLSEFLPNAERENKADF